MKNRFYIFLCTLWLSPCCILLSQNLVGTTFSGASNESFGQEVAISNDGMRIAFSADADYDDKDDVGLVRCFEWKNNSWQPLGQDLIGIGEYDDFGAQLKMSADGNRLAIRGNLRTDNSDSSAGEGRLSIYEYHSDSLKWLQVGADLNPIHVSENFSDFSLSANGKRLVIGHHWYTDDPNSSSFIGRVQLFENIGNSWNWLADISEPNGENIGESLALSDDGNTVIIGFPEGLLIESVSTVGWVKVYDISTNTFVKKGNILYGKDGLNDGLGKEVSISADGQRIAIANDGYFIEDISDDVGQVQIFEWKDGDWQLLGDQILGSTFSERFGYQIDLSSDGNWLAVSSIAYNDARGLLSIYHWEKEQWTLQGETIEGAARNNLLGSSLGITANGTHFIAGAPNNDTAGNNGGQVSVFSLNATTTSSFSLSENKELLLFPNPTASHVNVLLSNSSFSKLQLLSTTGHLLHQQILIPNDQQLILPLDDLAAGIYWLRLVNSTEIITKKIIKI